MDNNLSQQAIRQAVRAPESCNQVLQTNGPTPSRTRYGVHAPVRVDLLNQHYHRFLIVGKGSVVMADVYLLDETHILYSRSSRKGLIRVVKAV